MGKYINKVYLLFSAKGGGPMPVVRAGDTLVYKTWRPLSGSLSPENWFSLKQKKMKLALSLLHIHIMQLFYRSRGYCEAHLAYDAGKLVHYCFLLPASFRVPLMQPGDLEIGPYWTDPEYRGRGITPHSVGIIKASHPGTSLYILMRRDNGASMRVAEKNAFLKIAECVRKKRWLLARYPLYSDDTANPIGADRKEVCRLQNKG